MLEFLENVLINDMEIDKAVQFVNKKNELGSESNPTLAYYDKSL